MQPTTVKWTHVPHSELSKKRKISSAIVVEETQEMQPFLGSGLGVSVDDELKTGYGDWDESVIDALETEEERQAVRAQVALEKEWGAKWC